MYFQSYYRRYEILGYVTLQNIWTVFRQIVLQRYCMTSFRTYSLYHITFISFRCWNAILNTLTRVVSGSGEHGLTGTAACWRDSLHGDGVVGFRYQAENLLVRNEYRYLLRTPSSFRCDTRCTKQHEICLSFVVYFSENCRLTLWVSWVSKTPPKNSGWGVRRPNFGLPRDL